MTALLADGDIHSASPSQFVSFPSRFLIELGKKAPVTKSEIFKD
jgi:hypothetical protein